MPGFLPRAPLDDGRARELRRRRDAGDLRPRATRRRRSPRRPRRSGRSRAPGPARSRSLGDDAETPDPDLVALGPGHQGPAASSPRRPSPGTACSRAAHRPAQEPRPRVPDEALLLRRRCDGQRLRLVRPLHARRRARQQLLHVQGAEPGARLRRQLQRARRRPGSAGERRRSFCRPACDLRVPSLGGPTTRLDGRRHADAARARETREAVLRGAARAASKRQGHAAPARLPRRRRRTRSEARDVGTTLAASPTMVGSITVLIAVVAVFLAYNANSGLPFVPTYNVSAEVPSAELAGARQRGQDRRRPGRRGRRGHAGRRTRTARSRRAST